LHLTIDYHSGVPVSAQIVGQIKYLVVSGRLQSGEQIPSVRALAAQLRLNPTTVARVYRQLEAEGMIYTQAGRGAFIAPLRSGLTLEEKRRRLQEPLRQLVIEAGRLGLDFTELQRLLSREIERIQSGTELKK
jgi:GntR family transcriptional regulator